MGYSYKIQETLKKYIYIGNFEEFKKLFDEIILKGDSENYLLGTKDEHRGVLYWASRQIMSEELIIYLIDECGADINEQHGKHLQTALITSIESGNLNIVRLLLSKGANMFLTDKYGNIPIVHVIMKMGSNYHDEEMFGELYNYMTIGDKITKNNFGATPLHYACKYGTVETIKLLLNIYGIDDKDCNFINETTTNKELQQIIENYDNDVKINIDMLCLRLKYQNIINNNVSINIKDYNGDTLLHWASYENNTNENIKYLLMLGADPNIRNNDGDIALELL